MNTLAMMLIYLTIILGPIITMTSNNLFLMWVGLEMNLLAIIPLMISKHNPRSTEAASKYFIMQATASMLLLLAIAINLEQSNTWHMQPHMNYLIPLIMSTSLAIKLGLAPFHSWLPEVTQGIPMHIGLILLTWQKLAPLSILYQMHNYLDQTLMLTLAISSILIGAWNGLNQTQLRKIMAYSSISHMGWMVSICSYNPNMTMLNLMIYIFMTAPLFMMFNIHTSTSINSLSLMWNKMPILLPTMSALLLSTGGLPPLTGFMPKWLIINELLKNNCTTMATVMTMLALINLFFYTRIIYSTSLTTFPTTNNSKSTSFLQTIKTPNIMNPMLTIIGTLTLPITPLLIL
uniref:NADH dehydrogenase subunit 2 n=1 Tax=Holochilus sciureus TaxID=89098 RepID=UPI001FAF40B7|nr:NADH dehydrogenase subunit 2 [Holochilus sciureus]ULD67421.1 NADH dehydrogenase subunit 2 [Holochilus sciureus]